MSLLVGKWGPVGSFDNNVIGSKFNSKIRDRRVLGKVHRYSLQCTTVFLLHFISDL